ncbi:MAG: restriction endonuclease [Lachnospiraceae bacterium]|nr:restriction endonuclease [Lachnospiraceae bacterium]
MFNFANLNDVEFEYLCKDVMSKRLGVQLERFGAGKDGGIDLTDNVARREIVVQVKHYIKTDIQGLLTSLKKEIPKVEKSNPQKYYICCSKELTPQNKLDIYELFFDYMESTANIITTIEISDFLEKPENADILRKHFKLWIESTNILMDIFTNDICIDSVALMYGVEDLVKMFVKTTAYNYAISCLEKNNVLIIVGNPGVGKTITSKMLMLYYAAQGYRIRYTTDGSDLASLKKALSQSPNTKEIILLDDCFGQAYFSIKDTQENELLALIRHVKLNTNKVLIMNSRVTIFQEAKERTPNLVKSMESKEYKVFVLDMTNISIIDKAKILYNHLFFSDVPDLFRHNIREKKNYLKIIKHSNYNPRIIEFVTSLRQIQLVEPKCYSEFVMQCLQDPEQIWKNEYERRLAQTDRILLTTLYSLTNTSISMLLVKKCYDYRIYREQGIDSSINHYEQSINRLQDAMIKIVDVDGEKMLSVANPSVNDFLSAHLGRNENEKKAIIESSITVFQLKRLLTNEQYETKVKTILKDKSILTYLFESDRQKKDFIIYHCVKNQIYDNEYKPFFCDFLLDIHDLDICEDSKIPLKNVFGEILENRVCSFYNLDNIICNMTNLMNIMKKLNLEEAVEFIGQINYLFDNKVRTLYMGFLEIALKEIITNCFCEVSADEYDVEIGSLIREYLYDDESRYCIDAVVRAVDDTVFDYVIEDIYHCISKLPKDILIEEDFISNLDINIYGSEELVEEYMSGEYPDYVYDAYYEKEIDIPEIEYIFER